jgi:hypothetical protein
MNWYGSTEREIANQVSLSRRDFLRTAIYAAAYGSVSSVLPAKGFASTPERKVVVLTFGGGARDTETFSLLGQRNIPHLIQELAPLSTFYSQVVNRGILGHYVATASLATGVYERFDNFARVAPEHPTLFEYFRSEAGVHANDAWVVAPSNGFNLIGQSSSAKYGQGAGVILPKRLLEATGDTAALGHLLQDNYESTFVQPFSAQSGNAPPKDAQTAAAISRPPLEPNGRSESDIANLLRLSSTDFRAHAASLTSPDELSFYIARRLMEQVAPRLLWITFHDMDVAHCGAYSLYIDGIRRTDRLCAEVWNTIQSNPEYKDKTTLLILPDFGRDGDDDVGGNGFQHHRTGSPMARTTWMMAIGPGIRQNTVVSRPVESVDLTPTIAKMLGGDARYSSGSLLTEIVT